MPPTEPATSASAPLGPEPGETAPPAAVEEAARETGAGRRVWPHVGRLVALVVPPALYALIACEYFGRFLAHPSRGVPGGADGVLYAWYFEWVHQSVVHLHSPFFSPDLNAPHGVNVMWNTALLALAVVCTPFTATIGPIATVGLLMVLAPVVSASTCYFVLRCLTRRSLASAMAAAIYGFGPFFVGQQGHLHLSFAVFPPLLLLFGHRLLVERTPSAVRTGLWFGVVLGLQLLIGEEIVVLSAVVTVFSVALLARLNREAVRSRIRRVAIGSGVAVAVAVVLAGLPLAYQLFGRQALSHGIGFKQQRLDVAGLVRPSALQYFASGADVRANNGFPANGVENTGYLGWPLMLLLVALAVWYVRKKDRLGYWWLGTAATALVFSLGSKIQVDGVTVAPGVWLPVRYVPLLGGAVAARFSLITTLLVAVILARWLAALRGRALAIGSVVFVLAMLPLLPSGPYDKISVVRTPLFFTSSAVTAIPMNATVYVMPYQRQADAAAKVMWWQMKAHLRFRIIGGYSVFNRGGGLSYNGVEPSYTALLHAAGRIGRIPTEASIVGARSSVHTSQTRYIVITKDVPHVAAAAVTARRLTGCAPRPVADVVLCAVPT